MPPIASIARLATSRTRPRTSTGSCRREGEVLIIRTCSLLACSVALIAGWAGSANASLLDTYAKARAAESLGAPDVATKGYGNVLSAAPDNSAFAARALRLGIAAGDLPLAIKAAHALERSNALAPDARFLLIVEAVRAKDWKQASRQADALSKEDVFAFVTPVLKAWIAYGSGKGDPLAILDAGAADPLTISYVSQHRPLLLMAMGRRAEALDAIDKLGKAGDVRAWRLRMAAAASLARDGKRDQALSLLRGEAEPFVAARRIVNENQRLPTEVRTAADGLAQFFVGLAVDLRQQEVNALALSFARLSTFLAPQDDEAWLVTGELLGEEKQVAAAAALAHVAADGPFAGTALDDRVRLLAASGDEKSALQQALVATEARGAGFSDWTRLGDVYGQIGQYEKSADAYGQALKLLGPAAGGQTEWTLWLLRGGALEQADRWNEAKAALQSAYKLAPDEPLVLNYLGYAQLERRENLAEAERLIGEASKLNPDSPQITDSLGWARYLQGDLSQAVELLERAVQGDPTDPAINEHLGDVYYSAGRRYEARYAWRAALIRAEKKDAERLTSKIDTGLLPDLIAP